MKKISDSTIRLVRLSEEHTIAFKEEMQEAFQQGFQVYSKESEIGNDSTNQWQVLPDSDFYQSLNADGAVAYEAINTYGKRVGGAIIVIDEAQNRGELAFLYVRVGRQSKGIGYAIWSTIESLHPDIKVWETCTPYFERRNIHFYINRCGFHAVEFFHKHHPDPNMPSRMEEDDNGMFRFQKTK